MPETSALVDHQKTAARLLGVTPKALRDWMAEPGFPDCSAGYPIDDIRAWQQSRAKKGSQLGGEMHKIKLAREAQELRIKKAEADKREREEQQRQGNILPRDEYTLAMREHITIARDRIRAVPKQLCRLVPKKYHRRLQEEGLKEVDKVLAELARGFGRELDAEAA